MPGFKSLTRLFIHGPSKGEDSHLLVYRVKHAPSIDVTWNQRIIELADGSPVHEIVENLYREQLERGAGQADLGIWKSFFDRSVVDAIGELRSKGYLAVICNGEPNGRSNMSTTANGNSGGHQVGQSVPGQRDGQSAGNPTGWRHQSNAAPTSPDVAIQQWLEEKQKSALNGRVRTQATVGTGQKGSAHPASFQRSTPLAFVARVFTSIAKAARLSFGVRTGRLARRGGSEGVMPM